MAQFAVDDFEGTENAELSAYNSAWTKVPGVTGSLEINSGRLRGSSTTSAAYYHSGTPASADYSVSGGVYKASIAVDRFVGVIGRASTSANTHYRATLNAAGSALQSQTQLFKFVSGTSTQIGSSTNVAHGTNNTAQLELRMTGTAIEVYVNSVQIISGTDSSITSAGKAGVRSYNGTTPADDTGNQLADFSADDIGGGAPTISDLQAVSITSTTVQGTYDYAF